MDELLSSFGSVEVTARPNNPHAEHPHFALYKSKKTGSSQTERRKAVLQARKEARYDLLSLVRNLDQVDSEDLGGSEEDMDFEQAQQCYARPKKFKNFLMLSEWLVDVPEDFATTYLAVPCPVGKRCLVFSSNGRTRVFAKSGVQVRVFPSMLPGGNRQLWGRGFALLDCIWSEVNKTYYILDLVMWLNQPIIESETQFRFEWLRSRMEEEGQEAQKISRFNPYRFQRVPYYDCSPETLHRMMAEELPFSVSLDGVLFYHKESHYTHGSTPLVGWLKAYMFSEILGVSVPDSFLQEMPPKYVNLPCHIQYGEEKRKAKNQEKMEVPSSPSQQKKTKSPRNKSHKNKMEVTTPTKKEGMKSHENEMEVTSTPSQENKKKKSPRSKGHKNKMEEVTSPAEEIRMKSHENEMEVTSTPSQQKKKKKSPRSKGHKNKMEEVTSPAEEIIESKSQGNEMEVTSNTSINKTPENSQLEHDCDTMKECC